MPVTIGVESPLKDDVRELIAALNAHMRPLSPPEFQYQMTAEQMAANDTTVFVARDENKKAVGIGALRRHTTNLGEVKRMFTTPATRGAGVGRMLLERVIALATAQGISRLVLETGDAKGFEGAWRLYERSGFNRCGAFLDYPDSEYSAFFELNIKQDEVA